MSRSAGAIVDELNNLLRKTGQSCMTLTWAEFYELSERKRIKLGFQDSVNKEAWSRYQLIVAYGRNAVVVCHDRNFASAGLDRED